LEAVSVRVSVRPQAHEAVEIPPLLRRENAAASATSPAAQTAIIVEVAGFSVLRDIADVSVQLHSQHARGGCVVRPRLMPTTEVPPRLLAAFGQVSISCSRLPSSSLRACRS